MAELLSDGDRESPPTKDDKLAAKHKLFCSCEVCRRPNAMRWKKGFVYKQRVYQATD